jgi:hypothetical protein
MVLRTQREYLPKAGPAVAMIAACLLVAAGSQAVAAGTAAAGDLSAIAESIDRQIDAGLQAAEVAAAPPCTDLEYLRRATLDVAGRIPTAAETQRFAADAAADKRQQLVSRLLASPDFAFHLRNELDLFLLARIRNDGAWREYLATAVREGRGWDALVREILLPDRGGNIPEAASAFLRERAREVDDLTNDSSALLFGINISCAKCHDHPLVSDWTQDHFYGMASFFHRTYMTKNKGLAERFSGMPKFKTVSGEEKDAHFMFLTGTVIAEPAVEKTDEQRKAEEEAVRRQQKEDVSGPLELPEFSPRAALVDLALSESGNYLPARAMVNRTWARLMGRGLVEPLDQMHSENPPSHPELLDWLAEDFVQHGYDLRRLIGGIVLSRAYSRSSRWEGAAPRADLFAVALSRPLTPRQLSLSLQVATLSPEGDDTQAENWSDVRKQWEDRAESLAGQLEIPGDYFQVSADEALMFSNSERIHRDFLADQQDRLVGALLRQADREVGVQQAFLSVLSRPPDEEEIAAGLEYLKQREDRPTAAMQQLIWALMTGPEFRFNH